MSGRSTSARAAWGLAVLALALVPTGPVMLAVAGPRPKALLFALSFGAVQISTALVGAVVASRIPRNAVGWILVVIGAGLGISDTATAYGRMSTRSGAGPFPGEAWAVWFGGWTFEPLVFGAVIVLVSVFPTGRFLSPVWRRIGQLSILLAVFATSVDALLPGPLDDAKGIDNPLGARGALRDFVEGAKPFTDAVALPVFCLAIAALVVRFRRSRGVERQQLKWICTALILVAVSLALTAGVPGLAGQATFFVALFALAAMPVAVGVAIMRYRLYDIDMVINRALVYGSLTAILAGTYVSSVLVLQLALRPLTEGSSLAVAASTLGVAALFRPARTRVQLVVDRRFFRSRYDAALIVEAFATKLRSDIDLSALQRDLVYAVNTTVQPKHVSVWLASPSRRR